MNKNEMTPRERLNAALHFKETDRIPWAPLMDDYFISSLPKQGYHMNIIEAAKFIGCDFLERHTAGPEEVFTNVEIRQEQTPAGFIIYYDTPIGTISSEHKYSGNTSYNTKHLITNIEDVKVYQYLAQHTTYLPKIQEFTQREALIGDAGMASLSGKMSPVQEVLQHLGGVEATVYLMADYPDEMDELFEVMHERNKRQYAALLEYPCDVIIDYEDTSTTVMSRSMFTDYSLTAINDYAELVHKSGKIFITHMCGKLTGFINEIGSGHQDGIDSVCPPTTGDLHLWDARKAWGEKKLLIGGIDPCALARASAAESTEMAMQVIRNLENKRGVILSTGDAVAHGTPIDNLKVISELIKNLPEEEK